MFRFHPKDRCFRAAGRSTPRRLSSAPPAAGPQPEKGPTAGAQGVPARGSTFFVAQGPFHEWRCRGLSQRDGREYRRSKSRAIACKFAAHFDLTAQSVSTGPDRLSVALFDGSLCRKGLGKFTTYAVDAPQEPHYLRFVGTEAFPAGKEKARLGLIRRACSFFSL